MTNNKDITSQQNDSDVKERSIYSFAMRNWGPILIFSVIGFYLITEHRAHLFGALPWLILLACPFIHIFMHRGHGGHDHSSHNHKEANDEQS